MVVKASDAAVNSVVKEGPRKIIVTRIPITSSLKFDLSVLGIQYSNYMPSVTQADVQVTVELDVPPDSWVPGDSLRDDQVELARQAAYVGQALDHANALRLEMFIEELREVLPRLGKDEL